MSLIYNKKNKKNFSFLLYKEKFYKILRLKIFISNYVAPYIINFLFTIEFLLKWFSYAKIIEKEVNL